MQYEPAESECALLETCSDSQRLDYFLVRIFETEEMWSLRKGDSWFSRLVDYSADDGGANKRKVMPIWPYRKMAHDAALDVWMDCRPDAVSLEYFLESEIPKLIAEDIYFDIMPNDSNLGSIISGSQLANIRQGIIDAREYRMDD
jgi:hypothetical protein